MQTLRTAAIALLFSMGVAHADNAEMPRAFQGLSRGESYFGCSLYFKKLIDLSMERLKAEPNSLSRQKLLRQLLTKQTNLVMLTPLDELSAERKSLAYDSMKIALSEWKVLNSYCDEVSKNFASLAGEDLSSAEMRSGYAQAVEEDLRKRLQSVGSRNWRQPG